MMRLLGGKKRLSWINEVRSVFLPKKGFVRLLSYFWHRVCRLKASSYAISMGFACGFAISFTPLIGAHIFLAIAIAWIFRANLIAAFIGTFVGNPWTLPFIWLVTYHSGVYFLEGSNQVSPLELLDEDGGLFDSFFSMLMNIDDLMIPMLVGSVPFVVFAWLGSFSLCYLFISKYKATRAKRKENKTP